MIEPPSPAEQPRPRPQPASPSPADVEDPGGRPERGERAEPPPWRTPTDPPPV